MNLAWPLGSLGTLVSFILFSVTLTAHAKVQHNLTKVWTPLSVKLATVCNCLDNMN